MTASIEAGGGSKESALTAARLAGSPQLFERFPYGLAVVEEKGRILQMNHAARRILLSGDAPPRPGVTCCELICERLGSVLGTGCMTRLALVSAGELPEVRGDLDWGRLQTAAWVPASVLDRNSSFVLFHLRPGRPRDRRRRPRQGWHGDSLGGGRAELRISTLGSVVLERDSGPLGGD